MRGRRSRNRNLRAGFSPTLRLALVARHRRGSEVWAAMRAAVERRTSTGTVLAPQERISAKEALRRFQGTATAPASPRVVVVGAPADLCLLHVPLDVALGELDASLVRATVIEGKLAYLA